MAIKPGDLSEMPKSLQQEMDRQEIRIDNYLREEYEPGREAWVSMKGVNPRIINALIDLYRRAGWMVRAEDDQREMELSLVFNAK